MSASQLTLVLIAVVLLLLIISLFAPAPRSGTQVSRAVNRPDGRTIDRSDPQYWRGGFVYFNPDDPSVLVPKRFGLGFTLNMGHPLAKVVLAIFVLLLLLPILLAIFVPGFGGGTTGCHPSNGCYFAP